MRAHGSETERDPAQRVVITGVGVLSSIGAGSAEYLAGLRSGRCGARPITRFDTTGFAHVNGCEVVNFEPGRWIRTPVGQLGPAARLSAAAAAMAVADAGLDSEWLSDQRGLVCVGTTDGESHDLDQLVETEIRAGPAAMPESVARRATPAALSTAVARELRLARAEPVTLATACAAGNYAVGYGFDALRSGEVEYAICGGADAMCRKTFTAFYRLGTIAPERCQPFDRDRQGILTGEGAGVMVLETLRSASARGARVYAEVLGYGLNCDARHPVAPDEAGIARCMELALRDAGVKPGDVDLISAHGTGTRMNDTTEARAIRRVFGDAPPRTVSLKAMLGHTMGAASALAAIACSLAITHGFIPPTINHVTPDPECDIDCVPNRSIECQPRIVQNNGFAFGGNNAIVILGRC